MRTNTKPETIHTHEGAVASHVAPIEALRRSVLACMLWESTFYEDGMTVAERIKSLVPKCSPQDVADLAIQAREQMRLRHAPLLLVRELARYGSRFPVADTLARVIQRADELPEFLAMYWNGEGKKPIAKQVKKGLAKAFRKFDEYALSKYNRDASIKLRDVLFMVHAKPKDDDQAALWKRLVDGKLLPAGTWEELLSAGHDKREAFEGLLREKKLGYLALLRNLRNMEQAGVERSLVFDALRAGAEKSKALPFRFVAAARAVPAWERQIDEAMQIACSGLPKLGGSTIVLVDVSGSMGDKLSAKSDLTRQDAASALAVLVRGICDDVRVMTFSNVLAEVPARMGMALIDAIRGSQPNGGTYLGKAVETVTKRFQAGRLIVITDEQSADQVVAPRGRGYMINVSTHQNGVGYGSWTHINGWSESVIAYIAALEVRD